MHIPLYFKYVWGRARRYVVRSALVFSTLGVALLLLLYLAGVDRLTVLSIFPNSMKRGLETQLVSWGRSVADLPYFFYRFQKTNVPVYDLVMNESSIDELDQYFLEHRSDYGREKEFKNAKFFADGREYDVRVSYRGDEDVHFVNEKKSWRIKFPDDNLFNGMKAMNLIIPEDRLFIAEHLDNYRARKLGIAAPKSRFVVLHLNGRSRGVYLEIEQWGEEMLEKERTNPDANLYGEIGFGGEIYQDVSLWQKFTQNPNQRPEDFSELDQLLRLTNQQSDGYFWRTISTLLDMDAFFRWQTLNALAGSTHADTIHNARLYFDPTIGKFKFLPWDVYMTPLSEFTQDGQGIDFIDYNRIVQRILKNPAYLEARNRVLWDYVKDDVALQDDLAFYDATYSEIRTAFYQDTLKLYTNSFFRSESARARNIMSENVQALRSLLLANEISIMPRINLDRAKNQITFTPIPLVFDVTMKSLAPQELRAVVITGIPVGDAPMTLYYDRNQNEALDFGDTVVSRGQRGTGEKLMLKDFSVRLLSDLATKPEEGGFELGRTSVIPTRHRFFLLGATSPLESAALTLSLTNVVTGSTGEYASDRFVDERRFQNLDDASRTIDEFLRRFPQFFKRNDTTLALAPGFYIFSESVVAPRGVGLVISPGTILAFAPAKSLFISGPLRAEGTAGAPITFQSLDPTKPWGTLAVIQAKEKSVVRFARFDNGSGDYVNGLFTRAMASFFSSPVEITDSTFTRATHDDALNVKNAAVVLLRNRFEGNAFDAADLDFVSGEIRENLFRANGNDGLDISGSTLLIRDNFFTGSGDKGISVGEDSRPDILNNVIVNGNIGIAVKDSSRALILKNTIAGNKSGLELYQKKQVFSGARATVVNSILWGNVTEITVDSISRLVVGSSNVEDGWQGEGVVSILPHFVNSAIGNYALSDSPENSILVKAGTSGEVGGVYGERYTGSIRLGAVLAPGSLTQ